MSFKKVLSTLFILGLTANQLSACGGSKTSPYLPPNYQNPGSINNPYNPNNPNGISAPVSGLGSVMGRVVDSTGRGMPNVTLSIGNVSTTSSITGDFQLNNVPAGQKTILLKYGNRQLSINVNVVADSAVSPDINPIQFGNNGTGGSGVANTQLKSFNVDQDFFNQWQAKGVAASSGTVYVTVADNTSLFKKGSIIRMDTESGKNWKNIGSAWLGLRYPLDKTIQGIAINGTNLVAIDTKGSFYSVENKQKVKSSKSASGTDVAVGAGSIFISNGSSVDKADSSGQGRTAISGLTVTGGIGTDEQGNLYAVSGSGVKKVDTKLNVTDITRQGVENGVDVAVDTKNGFIYVLENSQIKRFTMDGVLSSTFGNGAIKAVSIATDELGNVYVADEGKDHKTSKIIKFGPGSGVIPAFENSDTVKALSAQQNFDGVGDGTSTAEF
ncbi:MAG: hypothetical protein U0354_00590 [Candidatus Sericytochromatia bacterium]